MKKRQSLFLLTNFAGKQIYTTRMGGEPWTVLCT